MTTAVLGAKTYQGVSRTRGDLDTAPGGGSSPEQILVITMNQSTGVMVDPILGNHGAVTSLERGLDGITTGSGGSAAADGAAGGITVAHVEGYLVTDFSVVVNSQRDTDPPTGDKFVLASKDGATKPPGGWSIEDYNDAGTVKRRAYIRDSAGVARWIGGSTGVFAVPAETAITSVLTYEEGVGGKLWSLDEDGTVTLEATEEACDAGLDANTADIQIFGYNGGLAIFDGIIDDFQLWDGALDETEVGDLDDPVSITHGDPPPSPNDFTCLVRSTGTLAEVSGTLDGSDAHKFLTGGGASRYDCRELIRTTPLVDPPDNITWDGKRNLIRIEADHDGACVSGGAFHCPNITADYNWDSLYQSSNNGPLGVVNVREATVENMLFEGLRAHGFWDGFQNGSGTRNTCHDVTLRKWAMTMGRDDGIENDNWWPGLLIDDCFFESFVFFSCRNSGFNGSSRVNTVQNCLVKPLPCRIGGVSNRLNGIFKLNSNAVQLRLVGNIFAIVQQSYINGGDPFFDLVGSGGEYASKLHPDSADNTICWLGSGSYPEANPDSDAFTILAGSEAQDFWDDALADWWSTFPGERFSFDPAA